MGVRVYLAGRVCIETDGLVFVHEKRFKGNQGRLAFVFLAAERNRRITRVELASVLWPGELALTWELSLSAIVSKLRQLLSSEPLGNAGVSLIGGAGLYQILFPDDVWIDLEEVSSAVDRAKGALRAGSPHLILGPVTLAANISWHPFLSGIESEWVDLQRMKLERQRLRAVDCRSHMWLALREPTLAVESGLEAIEDAPYRESSFRLFDAGVRLAGQHAKVVGIYRNLEERLSQHLGTKPTAETAGPYRKLLG